MNNIYLNQAQDRMSEYYNRKGIDTNWKIAEEEAKAQIRENREIRKERRREYYKESQRARYLETSIDSEGRVRVVPRNKLVDIPKRSVVNFTLEGILKVISTEGDEGIYLLKIKIGSARKSIFLLQEKMGESRYFMKKLVAVGAEILIGKKAEREEFLQTLWAALLERCEDVLEYPTHVGWVKNGTKSYRFVKEDESLWAYVLREAK